MPNETYIAVFALTAIAYLFWGFKTLPAEWQMAAAIPISKKTNGCWSGLNFTFYGILIANAVVVSVVVFCVLMGSLATPLEFSFTVLFLLFSFVLPAAKIIAVWIEKKDGTFTVAGAAFAGILTAPAIIYLTDLHFRNIHVSTAGFLPVLAALSVSYCLGEGLGRLACVSFGCCYGNPLTHMHSFFQKMFSGFNFIFSGKTKKIVYAHGWEGVQVFPVQAITSLINTLAGLAGLCLFVQARFQWALAISIGISFGWRFVSEFLRADYRGGGRLTAYQNMGAFSLLYGLFLAGSLPNPIPVEADLNIGLQALWRPDLILCLQGLWLGIFWYMGRSKVTGSELTFFVHTDQV